MVDEKLVYNPTAQSLPADTTAILGKLNNGELKIKGKKHRVALPKEVHKAIEKIAEAEGKTPDEKVAEIVKEKAKPKPKPEKSAATLQYPLDSFVNEYGFMRFSKDLLADLGWKAKTRIDLKVDKNADGSITLRKA